MKKTIKGVTYDTDKATSLISYSDENEDQELYQISAGKFFLHSGCPFVDGKRLPKGTEVEDVLPGLQANRKSKEHKTASQRLEWRDIIKPMTRREALAWCIRKHTPRTFHKDLSSFLK